MSFCLRLTDRAIKALPEQHASETFECRQLPATDGRVGVPHGGCSLVEALDFSEECAIVRCGSQVLVVELAGLHGLVLLRLFGTHRCGPEGDPVPRSSPKAVGCVDCAGFTIDPCRSCGPRFPRSLDDRGARRGRGQAPVGRGGRRPGPRRRSSYATTTAFRPRAGSECYPRGGRRKTPGSLLISAVSSCLAPGGRVSGEKREPRVRTLIRGPGVWGVRDCCSAALGIVAKQMLCGEQIWVLLRVRTASNRRRRAAPPHQFGANKAQEQKGQAG